MDVVTIQVILEPKKIKSVTVSTVSTLHASITALRLGSFVPFPSGNSVRLYFWGLQMVTVAMKLKDAYSLEEKL